jgi:hypothetical protein
MEQDAIIELSQGTMTIPVASGPPHTGTPELAPRNDGVSTTRSDRHGFPRDPQ